MTEDLLTDDFDVSTLVGLRHRVEGCAAAVGLADFRLYRFVVAVNEILTNAVRHGGGRGHLHLWRAPDGLHCRIDDSGAGLLLPRPLRAPGTHDTSGRGLWLVRQNVDRFSIDARRGGTTVTLSVLAQ